MCKPLLISTWPFGYQFYWFLQQSLNECESFTMCGVKLSACQRENVTLTLGHWENGKTGMIVALAFHLSARNSILN